MDIRSLAHTPFDTLAEAFGEAFATYEVRITPAELRVMLRRRGFDPALSFAAFDDAGRIMGFTLNGIGTFGGVTTAYDTGTGTLPNYRGRGLASRIFEASLPHLRAAGVAQYLLEVLQHNTSALSVYRGLGFEVSREFNYFRGEVPNISHFDHKVRHVDVSDVVDVAPRFWDFDPSWQNGFEAVGRAPEDFITLGVFDDGMLVGYGIFEPAAGDITQIAVAKAHRRRGIGSALLDVMLQANRAEAVKCINTEIGRDASIAAFLQAHGIPLAGTQFEMIKKL